MKKKELKIIKIVLCLTMLSTLILNDNGVKTVNASTDMSYMEMVNTNVFKAAQYLGYDSKGLLYENGTLFTKDTVGSKLKANSSLWKDVRATYQGKTLDYVEVTASSKDLAPATREAVYANGGTNCSQLAQYYIFGYLVDQLGYNFPGLTNRSAFTLNGGVAGFGSVYRLYRTLNDYSKNYPDYCQKVVEDKKRNLIETIEVYDYLQPGDIVCNYCSSDTYQHVAIYAGKYNGVHYLFHSGVVSRGPEFITLDSLCGTTLNSDSSRPLLMASNSDKQFLYTAYRMLQPGYFSIKKSADNLTDQCLIEKAGSDFYSLANAQYYIYLDENCQERVTDESNEPISLLTDSNGLSNSVYLKPGKYYAKEIKAPQGFLLNDQVYEFTISNGSYQLEVYDSAIFDPLTLMVTKANKKAMPVSKAEFTVYYFNKVLGKDEIDCLQAKNKWVFVSDEKGKIRYDKQHLLEGDELFVSSIGENVLLPGTYLIKETKAPQGYIAADDIILIVDIKGDEVIHYFLNDNSSKNNSAIIENGYELTEEHYGSFSLQKICGEDNCELSMLDAEYTIYLDENCQNIAQQIIDGVANGDAVLKLDEDGYSEKIQLAPGIYYYKETKAPYGFQLDENIYTFSIVDKAEDTVDIKHIVKDYPQKIKLEIEKKDSLKETNPKVFDGTKYDVFDINDNYVGSISIKDGKGSISDLPIGYYKITENADSVPNGYYLNDEIIEIEALPQADGRKETTYSFISYEKPKPVLSSNAYDLNDGDKTLPSMGKQIIRDVVFYENIESGKTYHIISSIFSKKTNSIILSIEYDIEISEIEGNFEVDLPVETLPYQASELIIFEEIYLGDNLIISHCDCNDKKQTIIIEGLKKIKAIKVDSQNHQPLAGCQIGLFDINGNVVKDAYEEECLDYSDENGNIEFLLEKIEEGYYLQEVETIEGYLLNERKYYLENKEENIITIENRAIDNQVQTGDETHLFYWSLSSLVSLGFMMWIFISKKVIKNSKKKIKNY